MWYYLLVEENMANPFDSFEIDPSKAKNLDPKDLSRPLSDPPRVPIDLPKDLDNAQA